MKDLFGIEVSDEWPSLLTKPKVDRAHAAAPGTGPEGETCGTCDHLWRRVLSKTYMKCCLMKDNWTGGPGSDIRCKDLACSFWKEKEQ